MKTLFKAIYERWEAQEKLGLTELYDTEALADAVFPYGTFSLASDIADWTFSDDFENCLVQFNLFSKTLDSAEVDSSFELLKAAFDKFDLIVVGYTIISLERESASRFKVEGIWQYNVVYRIYLQKD